MKRQDCKPRAVTFTIRTEPSRYSSKSPKYSRSTDGHRGKVWTANGSRSKPIDNRISETFCLIGVRCFFAAKWQIVHKHDLTSFDLRMFRSPSDQFGIHFFPFKSSKGARNLRFIVELQISRARRMTMHIDLKVTNKRTNRMKWMNKTFFLW